MLVSQPASPNLGNDCNLYNCFSTSLVENNQDQLLDLDTYLLVVQQSTTLSRLV